MPDLELIQPIHGGCVGPGGVGLVRHDLPEAGVIIPLLVQIDKRRYLAHARLTTIVSIFGLQGPGDTAIRGYFGSSGKSPITSSASVFGTA